MGRTRPRHFVSACELRRSHFSFVKLLHLLRRVLICDAMAVQSAMVLAATVDCPRKSNNRRPFLPEYKCHGLSLRCGADHVHCVLGNSYRGSFCSMQTGRKARLYTGASGIVLWSSRLAPLAA